MEILEKPATKSQRNIAIYGEPKSGKTRLAVSLPWGPDWGEKAVYVAWDQGSETLDVVPQEERDRFIIVRPTSSVNPVTKKLQYDPHTEAIMIASKDWKAAYPEVGTIIWDTMTYTSRELLAAYADSGAFSDSKHISVGVQNTPTYITQPMQGDYMLAQRAIMHILGFLLKQPLNVIVLFHLDSTEQDGQGQLGPSIAGKSGIRPVAGLFDNLFCVEVKQSGIPPNVQTKYVVGTQKRGRYMMGIRSPHASNPTPEVVIEPGKGVEVWNTLLRTMKGETK